MPLIARAAIPVDFGTIEAFFHRALDHLDRHANDGYDRQIDRFLAKKAA